MSKIWVRCPICQTEAEIDMEKKEVVLHCSIPNLRVEAFKVPVSISFPSHFNCELAKPINEINLSKLVQVGVKPK